MSEFSSSSQSGGFETGGLSLGINDFVSRVLEEPIGWSDRVGGSLLLLQVDKGKLNLQLERDQNLSGKKDFLPWRWATGS